METENTPKREENLRKLNSICLQLEGWAKSRNPVVSIRVEFLRAAIYGYSVLLSRMESMELELRLKELENKTCGLFILGNLK